MEPHCRCGAEQDGVADAPRTVGPGADCDGRPARLRGRRVVSVLPAVDPPFEAGDPVAYIGDVAPYVGDVGPYLAAHVGDVGPYFAAEYAHVPPNPGEQGYQQRWSEPIKHGTSISRRGRFGSRRVVGRFPRRRSDPPTGGVVDSDR